MSLCPDGGGIGGGGGSSGVQTFDPVVIRASSVLTASYVASPVPPVDVWVFRYLNVLATYTRGDVGGRPQFRCRWAPVVGGPSFLTTEPNSLSELVVQERNGPVPPDASAFLFTIEVLNIGGAFLEIEARESPNGVPGTPGTLELELIGLGQ